MQQNRIPETDEITGRSGRKPRAAMQIDLLMRRQFVSRAEM
jgi:hypothetical protein